MYNNVYEEYIRNMIGGCPEFSRQDLYNYGNNIYETNFDSERANYSNINNDLEKYYPEIYRLLYPMIQKACMKNTKPISKQLIDDMVEDIYSNFVPTEMTTNVNFENDVRNNKSQVKQENLKNSKSLAQVTVKPESVENRQIEMNNNFMLRDLIKILLLRELIGRPGIRPIFRPPLGGFPNRPHNIKPPRTFNSNDHFSIFEDGYNMFEF